ncbi:DUF4127 family protein [Bacillus sp. HMF5848]|uniref:DUF4127 family protein n=1 Tax=Bacillus sp. HMF5848 TaxID=2495421 RepID=UPI000F773DF0|nr:DUF4127 family protein [Bacillus sp. HMF5848]RSK28871.1 DUF4127 family protein [Bacillus sp. HMF5848]
MREKLALLPVDARPVTRELPRDIAAIAGWDVLLPNTNILGFLKTPADHDDIVTWLHEVADEVDGFVLSVDMLAYGGLVASRIASQSLTDITARIELLRDLKRTYPNKPIIAFSSTMRISNNYVNEEEKDYWADYGEDIWAYSYHTHKYEKTGCPESFEKVNAMKEIIPEPILEDYLTTRERNFKLNESLFDLVETGVIDTLVFPQDDTAEYGLNIREQEQLVQMTAERKLWSNVFIYPGADEVASVMTARMIYELIGATKPTFFPVYSGEKGALLTAMYEDRPIVESVKGQIFAFGSHTVDTSTDADMLLAVNVPGKRQGDLALQKYINEVDTPDRNVGEWLARIKHYMTKGKQVAVADVAYSNGADPAMLPRLLQETDIEKLAGFAAWNTAGNTIGTVVAQAAMVHLVENLQTDYSYTHLVEAGVAQHVKGDNKHAKYRNILLRLLDDYVYQTIVRQHVRAITSDTDPQLLEKVREAFLKEAATLRDATNWIEDIYLPWARTFEIGITLRKEGQA